MKITINIPDDEIREDVKRILVFECVKEIKSNLEDSQYSYDRHIYADAIKSGVRQLLKEHIDDITERAATAAAKTIANKGIKELLARSLKEGSEE